VKNKKELREFGHVKIKKCENDHYNEDSWLKRNFYSGRADRCFKKYTKIAF